GRPDRRRRRSSAASLPRAPAGAAPAVAGAPASASAFAARLASIWPKACSTSPRSISRPGSSALGAAASPRAPSAPPTAREASLGTQSASSADSARWSSKRACAISSAGLRGAPGSGARLASGTGSASPGAGGSTSPPTSLAARCRAQRARSQPSSWRVTSASSYITSMPGVASRPSKRSSASSTAGSRLTSTTVGWLPATVSGSRSPGSPSATSSAPRSDRARRNWSRASPGRASRATRTAVSAIDRLHAEHLEHVAHQLHLLVGLAQVTVDADVEGALAVLLAGTRGDHDDRHVLHAGVRTHVLGQLVAVHARHLDVQQHQVRDALGHLLDGIHAVLGREHLEVVA